MSRSKYTDEHIEYLREISEGRYNKEITDMFNKKFGMDVTISAISTLKAKNGIVSNVRKTKRYYTEEQIKYIKEIAEGRTNREIADMFNEKFNEDRTPGAITTIKFNNNIISFPDAPKPYTKEQIEYLRSITKGRENEEITEMFNKKFNDTRTDAGIRSIRHKEGILTGIDGLFKKGEKPPNWVPLGTERTTIEGYPEVKIKDGCYQKNWRGKHIVKWEEVNGPLPEGHVIVFGDGDKTNLDIDNLICVSRKQLVRLNQDGMIQDDADLTRAAINIIDLNYKISEVGK